MMGNIDKFDSIANQYDTDERVRIANIISEAIRAQILNCKDKAMIDFGCGTGLIGIDLLDEFHEVLFVDAASNMIDQVKLKIERNQIQNAKALFVDLSKEIPADLRADYIVVSQVLLHIKNTEEILSTLFNMLNSEGHLIIIDFDKNGEVTSDLVHNGFNQKELIDTVKSIGFQHAESRSFYHGEKIFMNKDASLFILDAIK